MESENQTQILGAIKDIVRACTFDKVDPDKLATFDLEYLFLKLRSKSVGEISKVGLRCTACEKPTQVEINLDKIEIDTTNLPPNKFLLTDKIGVVMTWPKLKIVDRINTEEKSEIDNIMEVLASCIDSIFDDKKTYPASEQTKEELVQFLESLNQQQFKKIQEFITSIPRLEHKVEFVCSNKDCAHNNSITLTGVQSFFA
jgi:hypothetical protein